MKFRLQSFGPGRGYRALFKLLNKSMQIGLFFSLFIAVWMPLSCTFTENKPILNKTSRSDRKELAVLNFRNTTPKERAEQYQPWEYGIASMLMTDIESIGLFNLISRERLRDILNEQALQQSGVVDPKSLVQVGKLAAAQYILTGSFTEMDGMLRIESQVFSVESGTQLGAASVTGETRKFFEIEKQLMFKISDYLKTMLTEEDKAKLAMNIETRSMNASLSNYAGEIALIRAGDLKKQGILDRADELVKIAKTNFREALKYDPKYKKARDNLRKLTMGIPLTL